MEQQLQQLREELVQVKAQRKQQLLELRRQWEEEKQRAARDHEAVVKKLKVEAEKMAFDLKKIHTAEAEKALDKVRGSRGAAARPKGNSRPKSRMRKGSLRKSV